jgi:hypothetical protein
MERLQTQRYLKRLVVILKYQPMRDFCFRRQNGILLLTMSVARGMFPTGKGSYSH